MNELLVLIVGLVVGSFLNAVIYRLHVGKSFVRGRSFCPHCKHGLAGPDLVPLFSFIFLRGKCRYCHQPISWQYPLVEAGMAAAFLALYLHLGFQPQFFVYALYTCFLMVIFVFDWRYYLILDRVSVPAIIIALPLSVFVLHIPITSLLIGGLIGGGFFFLQFLVSRGKWIGGGDIRLGLIMGFMLGTGPVLVALFIAYLTGSIIGGALVIVRKKQWKSQVPFGTFLSAATFITFLVGQGILTTYREFIWF